ncbi:MAG: YggT family protein [Spirochaetia bacterium]
MEQVIFKVISGVLLVYMLIIILRILLTWFQTGSSLGKPYEVMAKITDPYLNMFRRLRLFPNSRIDFSPILAIITLSIVYNITSSLAAQINLTLGLVFAIIISGIWSAVSFFLIFLFILTVVRIIGIYAGGSSLHPFWMTLDTLLQPIIKFFTAPVAKRRPLHYRHSLMITAALLIVLFLLGRFLIGRLILLLFQQGLTR